jgi:hypothetical protein
MRSELFRFTVVSECLKRDCDCLVNGLDRNESGAQNESQSIVLRDNLERTNQVWTRSQAFATFKLIHNG